MGKSQLEYHGNWRIGMTDLMAVAPNSPDTVDPCEENPFDVGFFNNLRVFFRLTSRRCVSLLPSGHQFTVLTLSPPALPPPDMHTHAHAHAHTHAHLRRYLELLLPVPVPPLDYGEGWSYPNRRNFQQKLDEAQ